MAKAELEKINENLSIQGDYQRAAVLIFVSGTLLLFFEAILNLSDLSLDKDNILYIFINIFLLFLSILFALAVFSRKNNEEVRDKLLHVSETLIILISFLLVLQFFMIYLSISHDIDIFVFLKEKGIPGIVIGMILGFIPFILKYLLIKGVKLFIKPQDLGK